MRMVKTLAQEYDMVMHFNEHMRWNGWGSNNIKLTIDDKPNLWPYIVEQCHMPANVLGVPSIDLAAVSLPAQRIHDQALAALRKILTPQQIKLDSYERLIHAYGKSYRDLWRLRNGIIENAPDCVCYPTSEDDICEILKIAAEFNIVIIPFGGGTNIIGGVENRDVLNRMVITLDMRSMNKVLLIDKTSWFAKVQAGALGPILEDQLNQAGFTLGHFPDSFEYSSLGGWVATRSAGMQSDKYGKIEDMVISMRMATPHGVIVTKTVPKAGNGIDINHVCIGSEGVLGIITEVCVKIHALPQQKLFYGYLFPDFETGTAAIHECIRNHITPVITRLSDAPKTALSFAYKTEESGWRHYLAKLMKVYLRYIKHFDFSKVCLLIVSFEGGAKTVKQQFKMADKIYRGFGGIGLGQKPGDAYEKSKYDYPYLRDYVMDYGLIVDVSETATTWDNLLTLYYRVNQKLAEIKPIVGNNVWCGCHISHTYLTGASLYFTFACYPKEGNALEKYLFIKKTIEDTFVAHGGCLSHHHAVGYEHLPWLKHDISTTGVRIIQAIKHDLDPNCIMNPGKLIPAKELGCVGN